MFSANTIYVSGLPPYLWGWNGRFTKVRDGLYVKEQHPLWGFLPLEIIRAYICRSEDTGRWDFYVGSVERYNRVFQGPEEETPIGYWANAFKVDTVYSPEMPLATFAKIGILLSLSTFIFASGHVGYISNTIVSTVANAMYTALSYSRQLSLGAAVVCGGYLIGMGAVNKLSGSVA